MRSVQRRIPTVEIDFTDARLTGHGGWVFLGRLFERLGLARRLAEAVRLKRRRRGATDAQMLLSLAASQVAGGGALSDVDVLRADGVGRTLLGLERVPDSRRLGEYLGRFTAEVVEALEGVVQSVARALVPSVVEHEVTERGYVPVFVDGSAIEVEGRLFERAARGHDGRVQYWLHGVFVGGAWVAGRLDFPKRAFRLDWLYHAVCQLE